MNHFSPLATLNQLSSKSADQCTIEILSENPCECKISFQSHVTIGRATSNIEALQIAAEEMLKQIQYGQVNLNPDVSSKSLKSSAGISMNVNYLKQFCSSNNIPEPSFEVLKGSVTMENTTVLVKCHIKDKSCFGFGETKDKAYDNAASMMLQYLKVTTVSNDNDDDLYNFDDEDYNENYDGDDDYNNKKSDNELENCPVSSTSTTDDHELSEVTRKYLSFRNANGETSEHFPPEKLSLPTVHLAGQLSPFFTENVKMLELKKTPAHEILSCSDPSALVKEICAVQNVRLTVDQARSLDDSCYVVTLQIHTNEMWTILSVGEDCLKAANAACQEMLLFFKKMME